MLAVTDVWVDRNDAELALQRCDGMLQSLAAERAVNGSGVLHVVVLRIDADLSKPDAEIVLAERSYGVPRERWDADYAAFAIAKARLSLRERCDSHRVHALMPQRLRVGDTALWGSVWLDGIVVGVSGCEAAYDEAAAMAVATMLRAAAKQKLSAQATPVIG